MEQKGKWEKEKVRVGRTEKSEGRAACGSGMLYKRRINKEKERKKQSYFASSSSSSIIIESISKNRNGKFRGLLTYSNQT